MAKKCQISGARPLSGSRISHAHNVTKRWQRPNVHNKSIYVPELGRSVRLKLSTRALRTIDKKGLVAYLRDHGLTLDDVS